MFSFFKRSAPPDITVEAVPPHRDYPYRGYLMPEGRRGVRRHGAAVLVTREDIMESIVFYFPKGDAPDGVDVCMLLPGTDILVFVASGLGFLFDLNSVGRCMQLPDTIVWHAVDTKSRTVVLMTRERVIGLRSDNFPWITRVLSVDGWADLSIKKGVLSGETLDVGRSWRIPFQVNLRDGRVPAAFRQCARTLRHITTKIHR